MNPFAEAMRQLSVDKYGGKPVPVRIEAMHTGETVEQVRARRGTSERANATPSDKPNPRDLAARFVAMFTHPDGPMLRRWRGDWYMWDQSRGCYVSQTDEQVECELYRRLGLKSRKYVSDARHALIAVDNVLIDAADLGAWLGPPRASAHPRDLAATPNGLIDLRTGALAPATPAYFSTTSLGVAYDPRAPAPSKWLAFLRSLWPDDDESIATLQEWFGYLLTPDTRQQKIMLLVGPKRSGKGTIMRVLTDLLGRASVAAPTLASLGTNFGLWPLIGKTAAIIGDARLGGRADVSQIVERLLSVSGDDPQTIDRKHREPWTGYLSSRITIVSNELPRFDDPSGAIAGRMLALVLERSWFGREHTSLTDELLAELPGILLWAIEGWRRLRARGHFASPSSSSDTVAALADLASPVGAWIRDACTTVALAGDTQAVPCDDAYASYRTWCGRNGHHPPSKETFGRDLAAAGHPRKQRRVSGKQVGHYVGIALIGSGVTGVTGSI